MTTYIVGSGQVSSGITLNPGDIETVLSGGIAFATTIDSGGSLTVSSGGIAEFATINSGGSETVSSGGSTSNTTIKGGGSLTLSGGSASDTSISGGSETVSAGGFASSTTINSGGSLTLSGVFVSGHFPFTLRGNARSTTINSGGSLTVSSDGSALVTTINSGGSETVMSGGEAEFTTINGGGSETVSSGGSTFLDTINSGGLLTVLSGGSALGETVASGGLEVISAGGAEGAPGESATLVSSGAEQDVFGSASFVVVNGGVQVVESGGSASGTTVNSAGSQTVVAGGIASNTAINSGGSETVLSGGTTVSPSISGSGAVLDLLSGAVVSGGITFSGSGGQLQIGGSAMPSSTISGFISGDTIDLTSIAFDSLGGANLATGDVLQITEGGNTYDLNLSLAQFYTGDQFQLTADSGSGTLVSINTTLSEPQSTLPVSIGGTATISTSFLLSTDRDYAAADLTYTVLTAPTHGTILRNGTAATSFTQADIDNGLVQYRENGDVASDDSFTFQVADPAGNRVGPEGFKIAILNTTAPVVETNAILPVASGDSATIGGHLSTVALSNEPAQMTYTVLTAPAHGTVLDNGAVATSFTQADIDNGLVRYQQNGDAVSSDSFTFQATDAAGDQTSVTTFNIAISDGAQGSAAAGQAPAISSTTEAISPRVPLFDLSDISFGANTNLSYSANGENTGGALTVSDGMHTANLALLGQYATAGFAIAPDQGGGTVVTYTAAQGSSDAPTLLTNPQH